MTLPPIDIYEMHTWQGEDGKFNVRQFATFGKYRLRSWGVGDGFGEALENCLNQLRRELADVFEGTDLELKAFWDYHIGGIPEQ